MKAVIKFTLIFLKAATLVATIKESQLTMMSLMPVANGVPTLPACFASMRVVVDYVNNRSDILRDYKIVLRPENEGPGAAAAPSSFIRSLDNFYSSRNVNTFLSPIILGPTVACQTAVLSLKLNGFLSFSELCNGPYVVVRKQLYSNLYRFILPGEYNAIAVAMFISKVGGWKQTAILTNSGNPNDYLGGLIIQSALLSSGIDVSYLGLDNGDITDETLISLKESGVRILTLTTSSTPMCINFLCRTYLYGMRAPQYVFVFQASCSFIPESPSLQLPQGCTKSMFYDQLKITFWTGLIRGTMQTSVVTDLGYDGAWFNQKVDQVLNYTKVPDDDTRAMCHDITMSALLTLNKSEAILQSKYNSSLRDFDSNPGLVSSVVNSTAAQLDIMSLRIGRMKYSSRLEVDTDLMWITQMRLDGSQKMLYRIQRGDDGISLNASAYKLNLIESPIWMTKSGRPPKDLSMISTITLGLSNSAVGTIVAFTIAVTFFQAAQWIYNYKEAIANPGTFGPYFNTAVKGILLSGCYVLNIASIFLVAGSVYFPEVECRFKPILTTFGISLIDAVYLVFQYLYHDILNVPTTAIRFKIFRKQKLMKKVSRKHDHFEYSHAMHRRIFIAIGSIVGISILVLILWLGFLDPVHVTKVVAPVRYDEVGDSYFQTVSLWCFSDFEGNWLAALVIFHGFLLLIADFYTFKTEHMQKPQELKIEFKALKMATGNATGVYCFFLLVVLIFSLSGGQPWQLDMVVAVGCLVFSVSTSSIIFFPYRSIKIVTPTQSHVVSLKTMETGASQLIKEGGGSVVYSDGATF